MHYKYLMATLMTGYLKQHTLLKMTFIVVLLFFFVNKLPWGRDL